MYDLLQSYTLLENSHIMEACCLAAYLPAGSGLHYQIKQSLSLLFHGLILYQYAGIEIDPVGLFACQTGVGSDLHGRNRRCERSSTSCGKQYDMCSCGCQCGSCYQIVARCGQKVQSRSLHRITILQYTPDQGTSGLLGTSQRLVLQSGDTTLFVARRRILVNSLIVTLEIILEVW